MIDDILGWVVAGVFGKIFFHLGRIYIRVISLGKINIESPTEFVGFAVSIFGLLASLAILLLAIL